MKVYLLQDVAKLGQKGTVCNVSDGYARNFLFPQKKAVPATPALLKKIQQQEQEQKVKNHLLKQQLQELAQKGLVLTLRADEKGVLYGSVGPREIRKALQEKGVSLQEKNILLQRPLKEVGDFLVPLEIAGEKVQLPLSLRALSSDRP